ncbi:MAG: YqaJ viral recombinase family protein [Bacteroidales bacterium]|nr:YqaJ viral recombinase family protein [Bacteroidales bacterium]MCM1147710.1 YqaJ viral recombinase family protein [Bacteroidales bacterium]MCM1206761.1 YqaJ viral recombinase family protein [Bacillota bacterium]MCM1510661.1 YqaJ viral recombinase family protein [Clostridium sp.]
MVTVLRPKTRNEWLALRESGIGSSEVATIMGLNPFDTPLRLWRRKKKLDPPVEENEAMLMGHLLEDAVAQRWAIETGKTVIKNSSADFIMMDTEKPYMRVSPDRLYWLDSSRKKQGRGIVECKTTVRDVDYDTPPLHWWIQLQYQMGVSGYHEGWLAWLTRGRDFGCRRFSYDEEYFRGEIEEAVTRFVVDNLEGGQEPQVHTVEDVLLRYPKSVNGKTMVATADVEAAVRRLSEVKGYIKAQEAVKAELEATVKKAMRDADTLMSTNGDTLATWKTSKDRNTFDLTGFQAEHPELYTRYMKTAAGARILRIK